VIRPVIYLIRHGQTVWNAEHRPQGRLDSPLTELGRAQAAAHAQKLADVPFTRAYTSPLGRARSTAERVLAGRPVPLTVLDDLAELDWGDLSGLLPEERTARFPELGAQRAADKFNTPIPGGESYATARSRAGRALTRIISDGPGNVLVTGHEMINRLLRMDLMGLSEDEALWLGHPQDVVYRLEGGEESTFPRLK
jgi:broad specificity phosphatase PhoE